MVYRLILGVILFSYSPHILQVRCDTVKYNFHVREWYSVHSSQFYWIAFMYMPWCVLLKQELNINDKQLLP